MHKLNTTTLLFLSLSLSLSLSLCLSLFVSLCLSVSLSLFLSPSLSSHPASRWSMHVHVYVQYLLQDCVHVASGPGVLQADIALVGPSAHMMEELPLRERGVRICREKKDGSRLHCVYWTKRRLKSTKFKTKTTQTRQTQWRPGVITVTIERPQGFWITFTRVIGPLFHTQMFQRYKMYIKTFQYLFLV